MRETRIALWHSDGVLYTTVRNTVLITLYFCGVPPETLQRWYRAQRRRVGATARQG